MGVGFGVNPEKQAGLGWIDQALERIARSAKFQYLPAIIKCRPAGRQCGFDCDFAYTHCAPQAKSQNLPLKDPPFYIPELN